MTREERRYWRNQHIKTYPIVAAKAAIVDGEIIKPNVYYTLKNGELVEAEV